MKRPTTVRIGIGLSLAAAFFALGYLMAPGGINTAKEALKAMDMSVTGGWTRRALNGEVLPDLVSLQSLPRPDAAAYMWLEDGPTAIAHGGGPSVVSEMNSLETIRTGYEMGFRLIEVDLWQISDDVLVCSHDAPTNLLDNGSYQGNLDATNGEKSGACTFDALIELSERWPEVHFVLDIKTSYRPAISIMKKKLATSSRKRVFIPQLYSFEELEFTRESGAFAGEIYTSYVSPLPTSLIFDAARAAGIRAVTLTVKRVQELREPLPDDLLIYTHPVNDSKLAVNLIRRGVDGIYTSYFTEDMLREWSQDR